MNICVLVANPRPGSRTAEVARRLAESAFDASVTVVELSENTGDAPPGVKAVRDCDLIVLATPTYQGTYTSLLKRFIESVPSDLLRGRAVVPVMTGGDRGHSLALTGSLIPLLLEMRALIVGGGHYIVMSADECPDAAVEQAAESLRTACTTLKSLVS